MKVMTDPQMPDHWKVKRLAEILYHRRKSMRSVAWAASVGHLQALWCRVMARRESGELRGWPGKEVANAGLWPGDWRTFVKALTKLNLIELDESGNYRIHDWLEHQGDVIAKREADRKRMADWRARQKQDVTCDKRDGHNRPSPSLPSPSLPSPSGGEEAPTSASLQQRTEEELVPKIEAWTSVLRGRGWTGQDEQFDEQLRAMINEHGIEKVQDFIPRAQADDAFKLAKQMRNGKAKEPKRTPLCPECRLSTNVRGTIERDGQRIPCDHAAHGAQS